MKKFITFLLLNFLFITILNATPSWYYNLPNTKQNFYIGYGSASSELEAKQNALVSISSQISIKIDSSLTTTKTYDTKDMQIVSSQKTDANLNDYKVLKLEFKEGKYFVAIEYENIPNIQKFKNKLKAKNIKVNFNNYFKNFELVRKDKRWYIKYQDIVQLLDKREFEKFFVTIPNENISIKTNKKNDILYDGDEFYFQVNTKEDGYISILTVYEDGTVSTLLKNIKVKANQKENLPDKDFEAIPQAGLLKQGVETFDLYVAIVSKKRFHFDSFATANEELIEDERYKNFDQLQRFLKDKNYTTLKVLTKPR